MSSILVDAKGNAVQAMKPGNSAIKAFTGTAATQALQSGTRLVRLRATEDCWIRLNATAAAEAGSHFLAADETEYFACDPGSYISVIQSSAGGNLYVSEGA